MGRYHYVFPKWSNMLLPMVLIGGAIAPLYVVMVVAYGFSPKTTDVGFQPKQPVPFSHKLHAGDMGIDCRYCHNTVEFANHAAIPPTQTCMNCHTQIHKDSAQIEPLLSSYITGMPMQWERVHDLPDYVYFSHAAHVNRGVSCVSCHGRIDRMEVVTQKETLSMGWCLECHRAPEQHLRDPDLVTQLGWGIDRTMGQKLEDGSFWRLQNNLNPSQDCSTCHR